MKPAVDFLFTRRGSLTPGEVYMIFNYRGNRAFANCHVWTVSDNVLDPSSISFQCVPGFPAEVNNKASIHADGWLA